MTRFCFVLTLLITLLILSTIHVSCSRESAVSSARRTILDWRKRGPSFYRMEAPILLVDNLDSLYKFERDFDELLTDVAGEERQMKPVVGIDCEWKPENYYSSTGDRRKKKRVGKRQRLLRFLKRFMGGSEPLDPPVKKTKNKKKKKKGGASNPVLVLQISTKDKAWIIDFQNLARQSTTGSGTGAFLLGTPLTATEQVLNRVLGMVLQSDEVLKVGLGPATDLKRLSWSYPFLPALSQYRAVLDLQALAKAAHPGVSGRSIEGLNKLCLHQLNRGIDKSMQCSDWSNRPLSTEQLKYASLDAHVLTILYESLLGTLREERERERETERDKEHESPKRKKASSLSSVVQGLTVGFKVDIDKIGSLAAASLEASKEAPETPTASGTTTAPVVALRSTPMTQFSMKKWSLYK